MADFPSTLKPDIVQVIEDEYNTKVVRFGKGAKQKMAMDHAGVSKYRLKWVLINETLLDTLRTFFSAQQGRYGTWTINDSRIGTGDIDVEFDSDKLTVNAVKYVFFNVEVTIATC